MSEKCFHCKRSLNKKFRVNVEGNLYCATCYEKLKKSGELKSKVTESKPQNDKPKANHKCKCNNSGCENKKVSKSEQMANDFIKTFREYNESRSISIQIKNGLIETNIDLVNGIGTETKLYKNSLKNLCCEETLKDIIKAVFDQEEREEKLKKEMLNHMLKGNLQTIQEQIKQNEKEME